MPRLNAKRTSVKVVFEVHGRSAFPTDMLRYDQCYPMQSADASKIDQMNDQLERAKTGDVSIRLSSEAQSAAQHGPTDERWRTFGWKVVKNTITFYNKNGQIIL